MAHHELSPARENLHGAFKRDMPAALAIQPGDTVLFRDTLDVSWGMGQHDRENMTREKWEDRGGAHDNGPGLLGPVAIHGIEPGDTLAVTLEEIRTGDYGWTYHHQKPFNVALSEAVGLGDAEPRLMLWDIDPDAGIARSEHGFEVETRPFLGTIGCCPDAEDWHMGWHPTAQGGNLDAKELVAGTTIYYPAAVPGGLFSLGDGHARQGDGEVAGTAIECRMERVLCRFERADDVPHIPTTWAKTPTGYVTFGVDSSLEVAMGTALSAMLDVLQWQLDIDRSDAMCLAAVVVDVRLTQVVNGVRGVHCVWTQ